MLCRLPRAIVGGGLRWQVVLPEHGAEVMRTAAPALFEAVLRLALRGMSERDVPSAFSSLGELTHLLGQRLLASRHERQVRSW